MRRPRTLGRHGEDAKNEISAERSVVGVSAHDAELCLGVTAFSKNKPPRKRR